jgi:hypothetical protein
MQDALTQLRVAEPEFLPAREVIDNCRISQLLQHRIQIDLQGTGAFHGQSIAFRRLGQDLADVRPPSAESTQEKAEPDPVVLVLQ